MVVVALGVLMADRVPFSDYNVTDGDRLIGLVLSGWSLAIAGVVWLIAVLVVWRKRHLRTRWLAVPPVLVVLLAAVLAVGPLRTVLAGTQGRALIPVLARAGRLELVFSLLLLVGLAV